LAVAGASGLAADKPDLLATLLTLCAVGVLLHASLIALNLHTSQFESSITQRGGMGWLVIIVALMFLPSLGINHSKPIQWWGTEINPALFWMDSAFLFAACATFATWRVVSNALQVRTLPWAWPAFAILIAIYISGITQYHQYDTKIYPLWLSGLLASVTLSYAALFTEANTLLRWRKLRALQIKQDWYTWFEHLPMWTTTLALSFLFAFLVVLTAQDSGADHIGNQFLQPQHAVTLALMLLRDACVLLFFAFAPSNKRALGAAMLYLLVLNILLPFFTSVAGLDVLRFFFLPFEASADPWSSVLVMTVHAAIALWLVHWRLRSCEPT